MLHAKLRDGSLRYAARERGAKVLLYEAGEAWRMDAWAVDAGVLGVRRVLAALGMTDPLDEEPPEPSAVSWRSGWVRARGTGMLHLDVALGQRVAQGERIGGLFDSFGKRVRLVHADPGGHGHRAHRGTGGHLRRRGRAHRRGRGLTGPRSADGARPRVRPGAGPR